MAETVRAILEEPRDWGAWKPGVSRPSMRTDRRLTTWIAAIWDGTLRDGREAKLEVGLWRSPGETGHAVVAHAGLLGRTLAEKLGITLAVPADSGSAVVRTTHADYVVVPCAPDGSPEHEIRTALATLLAAITTGSA